MIRLIIFALVFFIAVAISPFLGDNKGYILVAMGDVVLESTVVTVVLLLILFSILSMIALKVFRGGIRLSVGTWNLFAFASQRKGQANFNKGVAAYLLKDYQQAEQLLSKSAEPSKQASAAYLTAAMAAQHQDNNANAGYYLQLLADKNDKLKSVGLESVLVQLHILMEQQEIEKARELLDQYHTHIGHDYRLLAMEINLSLFEKRFANAIDYLVKARKQKAITSDQISYWESRAFLGQFNHLIETGAIDKLIQYWQNLPRKIKQSDEVIIAYCRVLAKHQINEPLTKLLLPAVKKSNNPALLTALKSLPLTKVDELMAAAQKHLHRDPHSTQWLSCLGHLACAKQDWAVAERAFHSLQSVLTEQQQPMEALDKQKYAKALAAQDKYQQAAALLIQ